MPLEYTLRYVGDGRFVPGNRLDYEDVCRDITQGETFRATLKRPRSIRQNAFLHALIASALENQRAGPSFDTAEQMRAWLLIRAGHCDLEEFDPTAMTRPVAAVLKRYFQNVQFTATSSKIYMRVARSIRFGPGGADSDEMAQIVDRVIDIICSDLVPGLTRTEIEAEAKRRARCDRVLRPL